ncbi:MAG: hypothetical protein AB8B96_09270 [Lysobacterales bacterium]
MNHAIHDGAQATHSGYAGDPMADARRSPDVPVPKTGEWAGAAGKTAFWLISGAILGVSTIAAVGLLPAAEQVRVLAALAAGFGLVHLWLIVDQSNRLAMLGSAFSGTAILLLALNALPGHPGLIGVAYALGALASFAGTERANPLLLMSGSGLAVLALLGS